MTKEINYKDLVNNCATLKDRDPSEAIAIARFIAQLVEIRNARGISQRELANRCNMPQSSVARIETLHTLPNLVTLNRLVQALGLTLTVQESGQSEQE